MSKSERFLDLRSLGKLFICFLLTNFPNLAKKIMITILQKICHPSNNVITFNFLYFNKIKKLRKVSLYIP